MTNPPIKKRLPKSKTRKFYLFRPSPRIGGRGRWDIENLPALLMGHVVLLPPSSEERGFPDFPEPPSLVFDKSLGTREPRDIEQCDDYWLVSDRMKRVLEQLDPDGVAFVKCLSRGKSGDTTPVYWLCDILRLLDAVDEEKSHLTINRDPDGYKRYSLLGCGPLFFREEIVSSVHMFRLRFSPANIVCDQKVKDACKQAGLKGIAFSEVASC